MQKNNAKFGQFVKFPYFCTGKNQKIYHLSRCIILGIIFRPKFYTNTSLLLTNPA